MNHDVNLMNHKDHKGNIRFVFVVTVVVPNVTVVVPKIVRP